jgi:hypothetical protein
MRGKRRSRRISKEEEITTAPEARQQSVEQAGVASGCWVGNAGTRGQFRLGRPPNLSFINNFAKRFPHFLTNLCKIVNLKIEIRK